MIFNTVKKANAKVINIVVPNHPLGRGKIPNGLRKISKKPSDNQSNPEPAGFSRLMWR